MRSRVTTMKYTTNRQSPRDGRDPKGPSTAVCDGPAETIKPVTVPAPNSERTATGQFAKGNRCSLGNPFARRLGALRSAFLNAVTDADVAAVARKLAELAAAGDVQAAALLLSHAVGKPLPAVDVDRLDLDEFSIVDAAPTKARAIAVTLDAMDPIAVATLARLRIMADLNDKTPVLLNLKKRDAKAVIAEAEARIGKPA